MRSAVGRAERVYWLGLGAIFVGLSVLVVYAWVEVVNNPGLTLVDGYWIGRIPWTPAGIVLVLLGSTAAVLAGAALALIRGDWLRRLLVVPTVLAPLAWWATGLGLIPFPRFAGPDPVTFAYSLPETAALMLLLPSLVAGVLGLWPVPPDRRVLLAPVRDAEADQAAGAAGAARGARTAGAAGAAEGAEGR
jgi:hypothetical protein